MSASFFANKETYEKVLNDSFYASDEQFEIIFQSMWSRDLEGIVDGSPIKYEDFSKTLRGLRAVVATAASADVKVVYLLRQGNHYAERHSIRIVMKDGSKQGAEAFVFGELDESGRIRRFEEAILKSSEPAPSGAE